MTYERYKALTIQQNGPILQIIINRPEAKNAVTAEIHEEFSRIFTDINNDENVAVVVVSGAGGAFSAGGDLKWLLSMHGDVAATAKSISNDRKIQNSLLDLEKPIIAKVVGPAIGLGCSLALFCDFVIATPTSVFADPHVTVGLVAGDGGPVIWPQLIGYARARKYLLLGQSISGEEAEKIGLITETASESEIDERVRELAERLAKGPKHALQWTKAAINAGLKVTANAIINQSAAFENVTMLLEDHKIALTAMKNRQKPEFVGR